MNLKVLVSLVLFNSLAYAVSTDDVSHNLDNVTTKIKQVNSDLQTKKIKQKTLETALDNSQKAVNQSNKTLQQLKYEHNLSLSQLNHLSNNIQEIKQQTKLMQDNIKMEMNHVYQQLMVLQSNSSSTLILSDNTQTQRKIQYLINILKINQSKYQKLQDQLNELNIVSNKLLIEIKRQDTELKLKKQEHIKIQSQRQQNEKQINILGTQIKVEQVLLSNLKQKQHELNLLITSIAITERKVNTRSTHINNIDEHNPQFFSRTLAKPLNAPIIISYSAMRGGVKNNGVLYNATNSNIYAISNGKVIYNGNLLGFGKVIVIDHGDNYMSIYGGVIPAKLEQWQVVRLGQIIASSGDKNNQPMGGVYFELRHFGKPVNPSSLVK